MSLTDTPNANRLHIALFGRRNSGKSSLINALTGQDTALVSDTPGTTTDPVAKAMEIHGIGPCLFIDTPGFDDEGELGRMRIERTWKAVEKTDMAILFCGGDTSAGLSKETKEPDFTEELYWLEQLKAKGIPTILLINKTDIRKDSQALAIKVRESFGDTPVLISAKEKTGIEQIRRTILEKLPPDFGQQSITGTLVAENDLVLLVMPQDIQAPKGRLILPQVQTIRELLDKKCLIATCTTDKLPETLHALAHPPKLIITDSQVFKTVYEQKPEESKLTSFSVLFAGYKGDIHYYVKSAAAIEILTESSRVLIAEACTHAPLSEATLAHEQKVTSLINNLFALTTSENDYATQSMLKWFIDEQVEEEENAQNIIDNLKMIQGNGYGLYMLDKELSARKYTQASPLATKA